MVVLIELKRHTYIHIYLRIKYLSLASSYYFGTIRNKSSSIL